MRSLGEGAFGEVYLGMTEIGEFVAVKKINMENEEFESTARREYEILRKAAHPNIVKVLQYTYQRDEDNPGHGNAFIFLEYVNGGSLQTVIRSLNAGLPLPALSSYTSEIIEGLEYLHSINIIHRDIKPANILLRTDKCSQGARIKLADFGLSRVVGQRSADPSSGIRGTPRYMSKQAIRGHHKVQSDVWSLGCTVLEMATGQPPYGQKVEVPRLLFAIAGPEGKKPDTTELAPAVKSFVDRCLSAEETGTTCADLKSESLFDGVKALQNTDDPLRFAASADCPIFRGAANITYELMWDRIAALPDFKNIPFKTKYSSTLDVVRYVIGREGLRGADCSVADYVSQYAKVVKNYFLDDPAKMIRDLHYLNHNCYFDLGIDTQKAECKIRSSPLGSCVLRPSFREAPTLALTIKILNSERNQVVKHYLITVCHGTDGSREVSLYGGRAPYNCTARCLKSLIDLLNENNNINGVGSYHKASSPSGYVVYHNT
eukprot:TRINITY_DN17126_c1_g1_i1.p1 TRINITY_DN17126_c1_g1~~TRINITY_DN17126_c1_g1_i1.p1  ORF type:complete len:489 (+),score=65.54 TRINITY_DN17126_c1_g1_i1:131-1597(+)